MALFQKRQVPIRKHLIISILLFLLVASSGLSLTIPGNARETYLGEIEELNRLIRESGAEWIAGETSLSRLSPAERQKRLGFIPPEIPEDRMLFLEPPVSAPSYLDWRNNGGNYITPVRDQKSCGSCWAFATTATLESAVLITMGTPGIDLNLAEQILVSCSGAGSCSGGYPGYASDFIQNTGLPLESCYPYTATNGNCSNACPDWQSSTYKISDWWGVTKSVDALKNALYLYGPLSTTMQVYQDFFNYSGGVYSYVSGSLAGGHAILLIGYDDAGQYFICKNSWGTWWGESGYFRIAYSQLNNKVNFGAYTIAYGDAIPPNSTETVSQPTSLTGPTSGTTATSYTYTTGGSSSSQGHSIQYRFDWGDGSFSDWLPVGTTSSSHVWSSAATYTVKSQARCAIHQEIVSSWSAGLSVTISTPPETVSAPTFLSGPTSGTLGNSYTYTTGGSVSSQGDPVQYQFNWGDGSSSGWLPVGTTGASKSYSSAGTYSIRAQARCAVHTSVVSPWSNSLTVTVNPATLPYTVSTNPAGLLISVDGETISAPRTFYWIPGSTHILSTPSPQSGAMGTRYIFSSWSDGGAREHTITAPSTSTNYIASFNTQYSLTTAASPSEGGSVSPAGENWFSSGQVVSVSANPNPGYNFSEWSGDVIGPTNPLSVTMNGPKFVTANFVPIPVASVSVVSPNGGEIIPSGSTYWIEWRAPSKAVTFKLLYSMNNRANWSLIEKAATGNRYPWQVPTPSRNRKNCYIKVIGYDASGKLVGEDRSDEAFTIQVMKLSSPNGGESLLAGSEYTIRWTTNQTKAAVSKVKIYYTRDGGSTWKPLVTLPGNPLFYNWAVPQVDSSKCSVRVDLKDDRGEIVASDSSDGLFRISSSEPR